MLQSKVQITKAKVFSIKESAEFGLFLLLAYFKNFILGCVCIYRQMSELLWLKIVFLFLCFAITAFLGTLPINLYPYFKEKVEEKRWFKLLIAGLTCFSGGVFLAVCFLHLLPETRMHFLQAVNTGHLFGEHNNFKGQRIPLQSLDDGVYPYPELIALIGFFVIYFIESSVVYCLMGSDPHYDPVVDSILEDSCHSHTDYGTTDLDRSLETKRKKKEPLLRSWDDVQAVTLIIALSINSMIEGLALGISLDVTHLAIRFIGILSHKCLVAFVTGLQCAQSSLGRARACWSILFYSMMTPAGLGLGILLTMQGLEKESVRNYLIVVLEGLSSGTFVYVTFFELLHRVRESKTCSLLMQMILTALGFIPMAGLICLSV